ncbi:MAG: lytic transglycosylase domain-containing protein [Verrucomicrobia bacterium]|nr:lytic transglycosylase domain-containing protein [Verrucomicrobiota bacterium]
MIRRAKIVFAFVGVLLLAGAIRSRQPSDPLDNLLQSAEEWARENLDESVLQALDQIDQERVRDFFSNLQRSLESSSVYDLAALKDTARGLLPLLSRFDETYPYAVWLQTRLDYLEAAEELQPKLPVPPGKRGAPAPVAPPQALQRTVWEKKLNPRPLPPRAQAFVPRLKTIFAAEKVPPELVWVAEVESSFDPRAKSPAGAAGMFQLMKPTAKSLGLSTWLPDDRFNPEKSGRAAAKYLRYLHQRFGDWRLALAAYNVGESRVQALLKKSSTRSFDAIASHLPAETQLYVPKCEATLRKREGRSLSELRAPTG